MTWTGNPHICIAHAQGDFLLVRRNKSKVHWKSFLLLRFNMRGLPHTLWRLCNKTQFDIRRCYGFRKYHFLPFAEVLLHKDGRRHSNQQFTSSFAKVNRSKFPKPVFKKNQIKKKIYTVKGLTSRLLTAEQRIH